MKKGGDPMQMCCRLTIEENKRLEVITRYARKVLEEHKSPKEIAIEEGITEEEVRKALFEEALELTGNNEAIDTIKSAIAELEQKEM